LNASRLVEELNDRGADATFLADVDAILAELTEAVRPGDVVAVMSNGKFGGLPDRLLAALRARAGAVRGG
jgi:UDP-N-acetylmuramate: L-alanyl-gamma-D-glutamyl-meso-diaminopimelate ligase